MKRIYVNHDLGKNFELQGGEHCHLVVVLRAKIGDEITAVCGDEFDYIYAIDKITKNATQLRFVRREKNTANPNTHVTVFLAVIKPDKLHLAITQLNEIGVEQLVLFNADRCNVKPSQINIEKLNIIAQQSCKQCGRSIPIKISFTHDEPNIALRGYDEIYLADVETHNILCTVSHIPHNIAVIIGPEGGFTPNERTKLLAIPNIKPYSLGNSILRAETACVVSAGIVLSQCMGGVK